MPITDKQIAVLNDPTTIVIFPANGVESTLVREFITNNAPKVVSEDRMFDTLELTMLQSKCKVCVVYRSPKTPVMKYIIDNAGVKNHELRPVNELMAEMKVSAPVEPIFTREGPAKPYKLNVSKFLEEIAQTIDGMRLDFVDKGEAKPQVLQLWWT